jgi:hypothetical protein
VLALSPDACCVSRCAASHLPVLRIEQIDAADRRRADAELQRKVEEIEGDRSRRQQMQEDSGAAAVEERKEAVEAVTELRDTEIHYDYIRGQEAAGKRGGQQRHSDRQQAAAQRSRHQQLQSTTAEQK